MFSRAIQFLPTCVSLTVEDNIVRKLFVPTNLRNFHNSFKNIYDILNGCY